MRWSAGVSQERTRAVAWPGVRGLALRGVHPGGGRELEELRLACVEERIEAELALGRSAELVAELEVLVRRQSVAGAVARPADRGLVPVRATVGSAGAVPGDTAHAGRRARPGAQPGAARARADDPRARPGPGGARNEAALEPASQPTPFLGRDEELAEIVGLVRGGRRRLLTLTGPGGSGKTRLAIETARALADDFLDGVLVAVAIAAPPRLPLRHQLPSTPRVTWPDISATGICSCWRTTASTFRRRARYLAILLAALSGTCWCSRRAVSRCTGGGTRVSRAADE